VQKDLGGARLPAMPALRLCTISISDVEFWVRSHKFSPGVGYNRESLESKSARRSHIILVALFSKSFPVLFNYMYARKAEAKVTSEIRGTRSRTGASDAIRSCSWPECIPTASDRTERLLTENRICPVNKPTDRARQLKAVP